MNSKQACGGTADTRDLGSRAARCASSSLARPTRINRLMIVLVILTVAVGHMFKGVTHMWISTVIILAYLVITELLLKEQSNKIHELEEYTTICAWCQKVRYKGEFIAIDTWIDLHMEGKTTHGICENCHNNELHKLSLFGDVL